MSTSQPSSAHTLQHPSMDDNYDSSRNNAVLDYRVCVCVHV